MFEMQVTDEKLHYYRHLRGNMQDENADGPVLFLKRPEYALF